MRLSLVVAASMLCTSLAARADTITANFTTGPFLTTNKPFLNNQLSIQGFNPALGTLNSLSASYSGSYSTNAANQESIFYAEQLPPARSASD